MLEIELFPLQKVTQQWSSIQCSCATFSCDYLYKSTQRKKLMQQHYYAAFVTCQLNFLEKEIGKAFDDAF